jgi:hypothetical protein
VIDGAEEFDDGAGRSQRVRRGGGGRPARIVDVDPDVLSDLDDLVEPDAGAIPGPRCAGR